MNDNMAVKTILFLSANPKDTLPLRLDEELREIDAGLRRARKHEKFTLSQRWAVRPRDIRQAMLDTKPQIVHFSGHGVAKGGLILEDVNGQSQLVEPLALAGLFELFENEVECVLLNACYSETQAEAIVNHIGYVIGMSNAIGDKAAIEFAVGFYDALADGKSIEIAYKFGCNAIQLQGIPEHLTPILKARSVLKEGANPEHESAKRWILVLSATIQEVDRKRAEAIVEHLRQISQDASLTLMEIFPGSVRLVIQGSEKAFKKIESLIGEGELDNILGIPIERVYVASPSEQSSLSKATGKEQHTTTDDTEAQKNRLLSQGERLIDIGGHIEKEELERIANELIHSYDNPYNGYEIREKAFHVICSLANQYDLVLDFVINNARHYIETQYIDDASPYSPNSFDVLSEIRMGNPKLISLLKHTLQNEWGIPRWEAIKALCKLNDPQADKIINDLIRGEYPTKFLDLKVDLDKIRKVRSDILNAN